MVGLLFRFVVGVAAVGMVGVAAYSVYKLITKDNVGDAVKEKLSDEERFKDVLGARVKEKMPEAVSFDILDHLGESIEEVVIECDEVSDDIHVGDVIVLQDQN